MLREGVWPWWQEHEAAACWHPLGLKAEAAQEVGLSYKSPPEGIPTSTNHVSVMLLKFLSFMLHKVLPPPETVPPVRVQGFEHMNLPVATLLGCQLDYIWNRLKPKQPGTPVRNFFFIKSFEVGRPIFNPGLWR